MVAADLGANTSIEPLTGLLPPPRRGKRQGRRPEGIGLQEPKALVILVPPWVLVLEGKRSSPR